MNPPAGTDRAAWLGQRIGGVWEPGWLYQYVGNADRIGECPANKRRRVTGLAPPSSPLFAYTGGMDCDYTFVGRVMGARLGLETRFAVLEEPEDYPASLSAATPPTILVGSSIELTPLRGAPVFVEESSYFFNERSPDGTWGNADQLSDRHLSRSNIVFLEGHVELHRFDRGPHGDVQEPEDFDANDIYVKGGAGPWFRLENEANLSLRPYGWVNSPR
jgi:hypothetical protein